ncbi:hypothetical protein G8764_13585 [Pseudomaricurvus alcaniphilus]|uniref:hypothetical protein n=1 Tax=Pseudomaricurvus alcaniphilus TaxID=1166482 RepID=UPI001408710D|nr:hypothetical protein [Pseudomaricurvus alcaniphilus]NHN38335.1 hypothetical protein [Pseudomaricurvus alcaniphilus]
MATALTNYYQQRHTALVAQKQITHTDLQTASGELASARSQHAGLVTSATNLSKAIAGKRAQMSSPALMPAGIEALALELRDLLTQRRHNSAALLAAEQAIATAAAEVEQLTAQLAAQSRAVSAAASALATAQAAATRHANWVSTEVNDVIAALKVEAEALLDVDAGAGTVDPEDNTGLLSNARIRVNSDIPEVLRNRARARSAVVAANISQQRALVNSLLLQQRDQAQAVAADPGLLARRQAEYQVAEVALKKHALGLDDELNRAVNLLAAIVVSAPLSAAESARISAVALAVDSDAITTETELIDAQSAVAAKQLDVQMAITLALVNDVSADPMSDATVQDEQNQLSTLQADLAAAEAAHTPAFAAELDAWEGAIPDAIWVNLHNYDQAIAALNTIVSSDGVALASAFTSAENSLVTALGEVDNHNLLTDLLASNTALAQAQLAYLSGAASSRQLSAARGDF